MSARPADSSEDINTAPLAAGALNSQELLERTQDTQQQWAAARRRRVSIHKHIRYRRPDRYVACQADTA